MYVCIYILYIYVLFYDMYSTTFERLHQIFKHK